MHQNRKQVMEYLSTPQLGMLDFVRRKQRRLAHALEVLLLQLRCEQ